VVIIKNNLFLENSITDKPDQCFKNVLGLTPEEFPKTQDHLYSQKI